jgi:hypothetical protein
VNNGWVLQAGGVRLKDFGAHQAEAWQAYYLIRSLHLTQHGTVGSPRPVMEYWLSDGHAPPALGGTPHRLPIDPATLRVEQIQGQWCVRDGQRVLFNFGPQQAQAGQALEVIRTYGFTQIGYVGWPTPLMMYFLAGDGWAGAAPQAPQPKAPGPQPAGQPGAPQPKGPDPAALLQGRLLATGTHQLSAPQASSAGVFRFDPGRVEVKQDGGLWRLVYAQHVLASFGNQEEARQAQGVIRFYRFTEQCFLGGAAPAFSYFLVHGQAPLGVRFGVPARAFLPAAVNVRQFGKDWMLCSGAGPLENFGDRKDVAQELVQLIQHFQFDHLCRIGPVGPLSMTFLVRTH